VGPLFHGDQIVGGEVGEFSVVRGPRVPGRFGGDIDGSFLAAGFPHDVEYKVVRRPRMANAALRCSTVVVSPDGDCSVTPFSSRAVFASSEKRGVASKFRARLRSSSDRIRKASAFTVLGVTRA